MKPVKNFVFSLLLVFAIAASASAGETPIPPQPDPKAVIIAPDEDPSSLSDPYSEQSGETIETSDYLLFETLTALLYLY